MGSKKKRKVKTTVFLSCEGYREYEFFSFIKELFDSELKEKNVKLDIDEARKSYGGTPEDRISKALKKCNCYNNVIAWLDSDKEIVDYSFINNLKKSWCVEKITKNISLLKLKKLNIKKRSPNIILATPLSIENVIIDLLGKKTPEYRQELSKSDNVDLLKSSVAGIFGFKNKSREKEFYHNNLSKSDFIKRAKNIESLKEFFEIIGIGEILN